MAKTINVEILGRNLGTAMSCEEKTYHAFTVYAFQPAHGVQLPELCDLIIVPLRLKQGELLCS
jgi:hypothetical protein